MTDWRIVQIIHQTTEDDIPIMRDTLVITNVPPNIDSDRLRRELTEVGLAPSTGGIPWANHAIIEGRGSGQANPKVMTYEDATEDVEVPITLRLPRWIHTRAKELQAEQGVSLNKTFIRILEGALHHPQEEKRR